MTKDNVNEYVSEAYPSFTKKLTLLEETLLGNLNWYKDNRPDLIKSIDFRPGTFSRMLSSAISVRFFLDRITDFVSDKDWDKVYTEKYIPGPWKGNGNFCHFKDLDLMSRFYLFHSFYHQLETTIRILCDELKLVKKMKPIDRVNEITGAFPPDFIILIDAIRNSIHNNGYYIPIHNQPKEFKYEIAPFKFVFIENTKVDIDTQQTLIVLRDLISYTEKLLHHKTIEDLQITKDKN